MALQRFYNNINNENFSNIMNPFPTVPYYDFNTLTSNSIFSAPLSSFNPFNNGLGFKFGGIFNTPALKSTKTNNTKGLSSVGGKSCNVLNLNAEKLKYYGFDTSAKQERFKLLSPQMQKALIELLDYAKSQGMKIVFNSPSSIYRTYQEQVNVWMRNSRPNPKDPNNIMARIGNGYAAKPGNSQHGSGNAIDLHIVGASKSCKDPQYRKLAQKWTEMGYRWGGTWKTTPEYWHFDLRERTVSCIA